MDKIQNYRDAPFTAATLQKSSFLSSL